MKYEISDEDFDTISLIIKDYVEKNMRSVNIYEDINGSEDKIKKIINELKQNIHGKIDYMLNGYKKQMINNCALLKVLKANGVQIIELNKQEEK